MAEKAVVTVRGCTESEKIIEKSRFITYSAHVESEEEARAFVAEIRSKHSMATHVCFAFISCSLACTYLLKLSLYAAFCCARIAHKEAQLCTHCAAIVAACLPASVDK